MVHMYGLRVAAHIHVYVCIYSIVLKRWVRLMLEPVVLVKTMQCPFMIMTQSE